MSAVVRRDSVGQEGEAVAVVAVAVAVAAVVVVDNGLLWLNKDTSIIITISVTHFEKWIR